MSLPPTLLALRTGLCFGAAGVLVGSLLGIGATPAAVGLFKPPWDLLAHLGTYTVLGLLLGAGFSGRRPLLAASLSFAVGVIDETMQMFHPGRHADFADLGADLCGALLAATIIWLVRKRHA
jgi:VanZ family protein